LSELFVAIRREEPLGPHSRRLQRPSRS
jgi:hypothetical protein